MRLSAKVLIIVAVMLTIIPIATTLYNKLPKPEILGAEQTWKSVGYNDQITDIAVIVKNNGAEGWITVYVGYQEFLGSDRKIMTVPEDHQNVYLAPGETKVVIFERVYSVSPRFPILKYAYAKSSASVLGINSSGWSALGLW